MAHRKKTYTVLLADDSEDDRFFLRKTIGRFPRFTVLGEVCNGQEAVNYLSGYSHFIDRKKYPLPDLVLLDLKMPLKNGFEVLEWLRSRSFPGMTVVVLSGSALQTDVGASLALGAHGYWTKTGSPERQNLIAREIEEMMDRRTNAAAASS